jgi:hypothetical protein
MFAITRASPLGCVKLSISSASASAGRLAECEATLAGSEVADLSGYGLLYWDLIISLWRE